MEDAAAAAMVAATGDRWSYYISAADLAAYEEAMANEYVGVGMTVGRVVSSVMRSFQRNATEASGESALMIESVRAKQTSAPIDFEAI